MIKITLLLTALYALLLIVFLAIGTPVLLAVVLAGSTIVVGVWIEDKLTG